MNREALARTIDHTVLRPEAGRAQALKLVDEALQHHFAAVCVNGVHIHAVRAALDRAGGRASHGVASCAVAGFPLGAMHPAAMAVESTILAKEDKGGADEIDIVAHLPRLLELDADGLRDDLLQTVRAVRAANPAIVVKVILETAALRAVADTEHDFESMIACGCRAARESGCDFVKTSTGFHPAGGATIEAVRLLRRHAAADHGARLKVKASGGIKTYDDALKMLDAGADRLGTSSGIAIVTQA